MGSRPKTNLAYIAGFLDGDGSLMIQIKKRSESRQKNAMRFMLTICFYQDSRHEESIFWIRDQLGIGYISKRNDHITELRINGYQQVENILKELLPYIRFKKKQAEALLEAAKVLKSFKRDRETLMKLVNLILSVQAENYVTRHKRSKEELYSVLGLTP